MADSTLPHTDWRAPIIANFPPGTASLYPVTAVSDPDGLFREPGLVAAIEANGFLVVPYDDPVAFRFLYEREYRSQDGRGLVVVTPDDPLTIPYDLHERACRDGRVLRVDMATLFPGLDPNVVKELDRTELDALAVAVQRVPPGELGANGSRQYILRHLYECDVEMLVDTPALLARLLRIHYVRRRMPTSLAAWLAEQLNRAGRFQDWPLVALLTDREQFLVFLQERWPIYVKREIGRWQVAEETFVPAVSGPVDLPFGDPDVRVYLDNLFAERLLQPTADVDYEAVRGTWLAWGVAPPASEADRERLDKLTALIEQEMPAETATHQAWLSFGRRYGEWLAVRCRVQPSVTEKERFAYLEEEVTERFAKFLARSYSALRTLPYLPQPVMLHHILPFMSHGWRADDPAKKARKVALLVVDGMAFSQWVILRESLRSRVAPLGMKESAVFAWIPTLTSVSRQSIFSGLEPYRFAASIGTTAREPVHFQRYWEERGFQREAVGYTVQGKQESAELFLDRLQGLVTRPKLRVLGLVLTTVDQMIHGTVTGAAGLHAAVKHWAKTGLFQEVVTLLLAHEFTVFLTADHGNLEAKGIAKVSVGQLVEERGERAAVFKDELLRQQLLAQRPDLVAWSGPGLPPDYRVVLAPGRTAFLGEGHWGVVHGGMAPEEVIVPFVQIGGTQ